AILVDPDKRLKEVLQQKHHHLFKCQSMLLEPQAERLVVRYIDLDGNDFCRYFKMQTPAQIRAMFALFIFPHSRTPGIKHKKYKSAQEVSDDSNLFRKPDLLLLKKGKKGWELMETIFDYKGRYQTDKSQFE
ncbi:ATP-dependent helicase, partial [Shewanella frigidimarina]